MKKEWKLINPNITYSNGDNIIDKILDIRGIEDKEAFLNPTDDLIHSPWNLDNMKEVCAKIDNAIEENKVIGVYYDVDTDGLTSGTQMSKYLFYRGSNPRIICNQRKEGHGVIVDKIDDDIEFLIVVDSSTNSTEECKLLKEKGIDIVILDHHDKERENSTS